MPVTYYGLFTCTSQRGERIEHYIHDSKLLHKLKVHMLQGLDDPIV